MRKFRLFVSKRRLVWWFISYLIIMIIPVVTGFVMYRNSIRLLEDEIVSTHRSILAHVCGSIDTKFEELDALIFQIRNEQDINQLLVASKPLNALQIYRVSQVMSTLRLYLTSNEFIDEIALYYPRIQAVVTPFAKQEMQQYHAMYLEKDDISYRAWQEALEQTRLQPVLCFGEHLYYYVSLSPVNQTMPSGVIMIGLNKGLVKEYLRKSIHDTGYTVILDAQGNPLLASGNLEASLLNIEWTDQRMLVDSNGTRYLSTQERSKKTGWRFVQITPYANVVESIQPVIHNAVAVSLLTLTVCLAGALLFAYLNYRPLSRLIRFVSKWGAENRAGLPEYTYLESQMQNLYSDNSDLERRLKQQSSQLGRAYLARLLERLAMLDDTKRDELAAYGIEFPGAACCVCVLHLQRLPDTLESQLPTAVEQYLACRIGSSVILALRINKAIVCVINAATLQAQALEEILRSLHAYLSQDNELGMLITLSDIHQSIHNLPEAYAEAISALEQRDVEQTQGVVRYNEEKRRTAYGGIYYPSGFDTQLINRLCVGDVRLVSESIDDIYQQNTKGSFSVRQCGYLGYHLCMSFLKGVSEVSALYGVEVADIRLRIQQLLGVNDILQQRAELIAIAQSVCERISDSIRADHLSTEDKIKQWVRDHYSDPELNVNTLSESLSLNASYVSRVFTEKTGETLSSYIQGIRIEQSLPLLAGGDTITEISQKVGFLSSNTFIRAFKKHRGITPGKYRELMGKESSTV